MLSSPHRSTAQHFAPDPKNKEASNVINFVNPSPKMPIAFLDTPRSEAMISFITKNLVYDR